MNSAYQLTPSAIEDLNDIWNFIAADKPHAADRVEFEITKSFQLLANHPLIGIRREEITTLPVRFLTVSKFPNYVIIYRPDRKPLQIIAVVSGKRDLKSFLGRRV